MSEKRFYVLRYVSILAVVFSFVGSVLMFVMGSVKTLKAVEGYASPTGFGDAALAENLSAAD